MYIVELFIKLKNDFIAKRNKNVEMEEEKDSCNHLFIPIDSTGRILACSKCGEVYKLKKGEVNPFQ